MVGSQILANCNGLIRFVEINVGNFEVKYELGFFKMGQPWNLLHLFSVFSNKKCEK